MRGVGARLLSPYPVSEIQLLTMIRNKALEKKYGTVSASTGRVSASQKMVLHRAIRDELLGGNILLDLNEMMFLLGGHKNRSEECRQFARFCSTAIGNIKKEMAEEIERRYAEPVGREAVGKFLEELDVMLKAGRLSKDTFDALTYVHDQFAMMLAEMDGETIKGKTDGE